VCNDCVSREHTNHPCVKFSDAVTTESMNLSSDVSRLTTKKCELDVLFSLVTSAILKVKQDKLRAQIVAQAAAVRLIELIQQRVSVWISQVTIEQDNKLSLLESQATHLRDLIFCVFQALESQPPTSSCDPLVVLQSVTTVSRAVRLVNSTEPIRVNSVEFDSILVVDSAVRELQKLLYSPPVSATHTTFSLTPSDSIVIPGQNLDLNVVPLDPFGHSSMISHASAVLSATLNDSPVSLSVSRDNLSLFGQVCIPSSASVGSTHSFHVLVRSVDVLGSPKTLTVVQKLFSDSLLLTNPKWKENLVSWRGKEPFESRLLYLGSRDGFSASTFHSRCDNQSETFVIIRMKPPSGVTWSQNPIIGGYSDKPWKSHSSGENISSDHSFLFSFFGTSSSYNTPQKYALTGKNNQYAIHCYSSCGPIFGGGNDLDICDDCNTNPYNYINGINYPSYSPFNIGTSGQTSFLVDEIEVFAVC